MIRDRFKVVVPDSLQFWPHQEKLACYALEIRRDFLHSSLALNHLLYMCNQVETFVAEGRRDKAFRWLGFIQGAMWEFTPIDTLKAMNAPDPERIEYSPFVSTKRTE